MGWIAVDWETAADVGFVVMYARVLFMNFGGEDSSIDGFSGENEEKILY